MEIYPYSGSLDIPDTVALPSHELFTSTHYHAWITDLTPILCPISGNILFRSLFIHLITFCGVMLVNFSLLCFSTVVLEKTLESPLDCKEIQPVHPKGNQS